MSIFRQHKSSSDRSASDRRRHKTKIEKAIKDGIHNIIAEESIIGKDGKKKIRIPVKGIKEYRFVYGDNKTNKKVGSAPGKNIKRGQKIGDKRKTSPAHGNKPGDKPGEEYYDVEVTLEELSRYLFEDLNLPELEKKKFKFVTQEKPKRKGHRNQGIRIRLSKKETIKNKLKRKAIAKKLGTYDEDSDERFPFHESDLRYRHFSNKPKENSCAVVFFIMDVSGSMSTQKKYIARSFYFLVYQFLRYKYENIEIIFISHDTSAKEVTEDEFFSRGSSGGTLISPALSLMGDIVEKRYHPTMWNIYGFHCSDGDNWSDDIPRTLTETKKLIDMCQVYTFCEITPEGETYGKDFSDTYSTYLPFYGKKFKIVKITSPSEIWPVFKKVFGGREDV